LFKRIVEKIGAGRAVLSPFDTADHEDRQFVSDLNLSFVWRYLKDILV